VGEQFSSHVRERVAWASAKLHRRVAAAWRALAYVLARLPLALVSLVLGVGCYAYGLALLTYIPLQERPPPSEFGRSENTPRQGSPSRDEDLRRRHFTLQRVCVLGSELVSARDS